MPIKELAQIKFKKFVKTIEKLISTQKFDFIVAAGNSGIITGKITGEIYKQLDIIQPPLLQLPIIRLINRSESTPFTKNHTLIPEIEQFFIDNKIKSIKNILFVDDEICVGRSAGESIRIIIQAGKNQNISIEGINFVIVAEDHSGDHGLTACQITDVNVSLSAYDVLDHHNNNIILRYLPEEIEKPARVAFDELIQTQKLEKLRIVNILLNLPISEKKDVDKPKFSDEYNKQALTIVKDLNKLQEEAWKYTQELIHESIKQSEE